MARKKTQLVCQHMERLSAGFLEKHHDLIRDHIKGRHGIYALYKRDRLHYVGLARNLSSRLKAHLRDRHRGLWDTFSVYITIESHHIKELESLLLRIANPQGNSVSGKLARSQDIKKELAKAIRQRQNEEFKVLMGRQARVSRPRRKKTRVKRGDSETALGPYVSESFLIRKIYKGKSYQARVRKNGWIYYKAHLYNSPSLLAKEITGHPANGWYFWNYQRSPGEWVSLHNLKQ